MFHRRSTIVIGSGVALVVLTAGAALGYWWFGTDHLLAEYPSSPFPAVGPEFPRIIPLEDSPPRENKEAYDAYWAKIGEVAKYLREDGVMREATPDEREAYRLAVQRSEYVAGRELAVKVLKERPDSLPARFVLAVVEHEGEANFGRALSQIRRLRHAMHRRGLENPQDSLAREWYLRSLYRETLILDTMNRSEEQLCAIQRMEQLYEPLPWMRVWPLIELERFDEARAAIDELGKSGHMPARLRNYRLSIETELGHRKEAYESGKAVLEQSQTSAVFLSNHSGSCTFNFLFAEAEDAMLKSTRCQTVDFRGSPFTYLAQTLAEKGQLSEAWEALKRAQAQRRDREAYTLVADQSTFDRATAYVLFLLGHGEDAYRLGRRSLDLPGRNRTSQAAREYGFNLRFTPWVLMHHRQAELQEIQAAGGVRAATVPAELRSLALDRWVLERQLLKIISDDDYLVGLMRPLMPGMPSPNTVFLPDLAGLLPTGVARDVLRRAREAEDHLGATPYFDAIDAELAWSAGRFDDALALANKALEGLSPDYEHCLRGRLAVIAGDCHQQLGQTDEALRQFDQALEMCPVMFRMLGVPIPVVIAEDGSPLVAQWVKRVLSNPRFRADPRGFQLVLRMVDAKLTFELFRLKDVRYCEGNVPIAGPEDEIVAAAMRRLITRIMSPVLDLTPTDINSLDNSLFAAPPTHETDRLLRLVKPQ